MKPGIQILNGHVSQETAYLQTDYPYGRQLRCHRRTWIETKPGHGQRFVYQTSDPKMEQRRGMDPGTCWHNAPKTSTYSTMMIMYLITEGEEVGHVEHDVLHLNPYDQPLRNEARVNEFLEKYGEENVLADPYRAELVGSVRRRAERHRSSVQRAKLEDAMIEAVREEREGGPHDPEVGGGAE